MIHTKRFGLIILCAILVFILIPASITADAASSIYCPECGKQIAAESKYCMYCGNRIPTTSSSSTASQKSISVPGNTRSPYIIGTSENTFAGLHKAMCINLDLKRNPLPEMNSKISEYSDGDYVYGSVLKDDSDSYEYIGYIRNKQDQNQYLVRNWTGYHKDGSVIEMTVYYTLEGKYLGNIQRDKSAGTSTSSHNSPYYIPGEPINKE